MSFDAYYKLPKICFLYICCRPNEKEPKFDVSLQPTYFTIYSLMVSPFEKFLTDNLKTCPLIIIHLNITKTFHLINSKNLPGEFYATVAPGFWPLSMLILLKIHSSDTPLPPPDGGGESEKLKKDGGSRVQGQVFLKGREGRGGGGDWLAPFLFHFFMVYQFHI